MHKPDFYPNNLLPNSLTPETVAVAPDTMPDHTPAQDVPNYPVADPAGDELSVSEIVTDGDTVTEEGDSD